ncbi:MAG TPA: hypothetical protein VJ692_04080, partial [Nitrospiraceae bacterium]|nr:hypothetical protein [Nitrospiraceae bacterium]
MNGASIAEPERLFHAGVIFFCALAIWPSTVRSEGGSPPDGTVSNGNPARQEASHLDRVSHPIHNEGTHSRVPVMRPDGTILLINRNKFFLDETLRLPPWLHLGLQHRDRYESYNEPFRKGETTGAQQVALQTLARFGIRYDPVRFFAEL